jgi:hypothetical protein
MRRFFLATAMSLILSASSHAGITITFSTDKSDPGDNTPIK